MADLGLDFAVEEKNAKEYFLAQAGLQFMRDHALYVGIADGLPVKDGKRSGQDSNARDEFGGVTNAELLFIHTNGATLKERSPEELAKLNGGSPIKDIPPRPVIEPAIEDDKDRLDRMLMQSADQALDGKLEKALELLKKTGVRAQSVCMRWFVNPKNNWPPNSPATFRRKQKKGATINRPLIDTSQLRNSITYFIQTKGGKLE